MSFIFFKFETKFILRISGLPKLGIFRKFYGNKLYQKFILVTCPTVNQQQNILKSLGIVDKTQKLKLLYDPIVSEVSKSNLPKKKPIIRLTF